MLWASKFVSLKTYIVNKPLTNFNGSAFRASLSSLWRVISSLFGVIFHFTFILAFYPFSVSLLNSPIFTHPHKPSPTIPRFLINLTITTCLYSTHYGLIRRRSGTLDRKCESIGLQRRELFFESII